MPGGHIKCKSCEDFTCTGPIPFEMHVASQKHLKNVLRNKESSARTSSPDLPSTAYDDMPQSSSASEDMSNACKLYRLQNTINPQNNVFFV